MPDIGSTPRFVQRLAEGARRERLSAPIIAARPNLLLISAPSGYGKTVLAAQIAVSGVFSRVVWIRSGGGGSLQDCLQQVASRLVSTPAAQGVGSLPEVCELCSDALGRMGDSDATLIVFDDSAWAADSSSLDVLTEILCDAPLGSMAIVTTRVEIPLAAANVPTAWLLDACQLMLSDDEIGDVWSRHAGASVTPQQMAEIASTSGRHAALVSLMARHAALSGTNSYASTGAANVASLLKRLVFEQLDEGERRLLDYAAVLGQGTEERLRAVADMGEISTSLTRLASVLPLVSLSNGASHRRFVVHDLVGEACDSVASLRSRDRAGLYRASDSMIECGDYSRAMKCAVDSQDSELLTLCLHQAGPHLLKCAAWEMVKPAIEMLAPQIVASDPALMIISAEVAWAEGRSSEAIRQAALAVRLGELSGHGRMSAARSLLAAMRISEADCSGAAAELAPLLEAESEATSDELADILYPAILAYAFLGDRAGLNRCLVSAQSIIDDQSAGNFRISRLQMAMGIAVNCLDSDHRRSMELLQNASSRTDVPLHQRSRALCNYAACALECGDVEQARIACGAASESGTAFSTESEHELPALVLSVANAVISGDTALRDVASRLIGHCETEGETFTLLTTCNVAAQAALAIGDVEYARRVAERGLLAAAATGSPVLLWLGELVHAMTLLAGGSLDRAKSVVLRILPLADSLGAMGHVFHCRLILAVIALREGDFAQAIEQLSMTADHIIRATPMLYLAVYVRAFPELLGPVALAVGVDQLPEGFFRLIRGGRSAAAVEQAAQALSPSELSALAARMSDRAVEESRDSIQEPEAICRVRLFGGLEVVTPRGQVGERDWSKRKARLLFAMLVSRMGTDVPRGEIIEYLWPDMQEERALNNFYVVWSAMKRAISPESIRDTPCPYVEHVRGVCRIVKQHVISDLEEFSDLVSIARQARHDGDIEGELAALRALADVYRGEVLPGDVYDDWFAPLRDRFRHDFEDAMLRASTILEEQGDPHGGLQLLRRAMAADPWREDLYQAQLRMQIAAGQRSAAIETYMLCRSRLTADLGIDPSRETTALYERVLGMEEPDGLSRV